MQEMIKTARQFAQSFNALTIQEKRKVLAACGAPVTSTGHRVYYRLSEVQLLLCHDLSTGEVFLAGWEHFLPYMVNAQRMKTLFYEGKN